jgi:murein DD-endopeptidase
MISQRATNPLYCSVFVVVLTIMSGCSGNDARPSNDSPDRQSDTVKSVGTASRAASVARQQVGTPYRYGGSDPSGFDCSGLVHYAYGKTGVALPRTTGGLWSGLRPVSRSDMRRGDIVFFRIEGKIAHVGMYLGNGEFVHSPATGRSVSIASMNNDYYSRAFVRAGRAF